MLITADAGDASQGGCMPCSTGQMQQGRENHTRCYETLPRSDLKEKLCRSCFVGGFGHEQEWLNAPWCDVLVCLGPGIAGGEGGLRRMQSVVRGPLQSSQVREVIMRHERWDTDSPKRGPLSDECRRLAEECNSRVR
eukprot:1161078-Pelagomonas_calceolata.AAC.27